VVDGQSVSGPEQYTQLSSQPGTLIGTVFCTGIVRVIVK